jgi:hypothetical protein
MMWSCRQSVALTLALLLFGGSLAGSVHYVTVEHEVCSVHGEVTHGDEHGVEIPDSEAPSVHDVPDGEHEHDCTLTTVQRAEEPAVHPGSSLEGPAVVPVAYLSASSPTISFGSVLDAAPKTSPPA